MSLTGTEKWGLETLYDMPSGQVDLLDTIGNEHPHLKNGLCQDLFTDTPLRGLRGDFMEALGDDKFLDSCSQQAKEDPDIINRMNYLIENDPEKLRKMLPEIKKNPDQLADILNESVTQEQAQVAKVSAEMAAKEAASNPLGQFADMDFGKMFDGFDMSDMLGKLGETLLSMFSGLYGMMDKLMDGIGKFANSGELVAAGSSTSDPNGPLNQVAKFTNSNQLIHTEENGKVQSATLEQRLDNNKPAAATPEAAPANIAEVNKDITNPNPDMKMEPGGSSTG